MVIFLDDEDSLHGVGFWRVGRRLGRSRVSDLSVAGSCMVSAWMGSESTLVLCAVVILAVQESPGRNSLPGSSSVTTTLKSLASSVPEVDCEVATPVERKQSLMLLFCIFFTG